MIKRNAIFITFIILCFLVNTAILADEDKGVRVSQVIENGVSIELFVKPIWLDKKNKTSSGTTQDFKIRHGDDVILNFYVTDTFTNSPVKGLFPDSFAQKGSDSEDPELVKKSIDHCRFRALKRGRMNERHPSLIENTYVMCLNALDNSVSVINPLMKPKTIVKKIELGEKCNNINMEKYGSDLYVTCESGNVAIINCFTFEVIGRIKVGKEPYHIEFQPDGRYVWIGNDGDGTVSIINTKTRTVVKNIQVGKGHHEFAFTDDSFYAYVTNRDENSVTVIDVLRLEPVLTIEVGVHPHGLAYSRLSQYIYVANEGSGTVTVIDTVKQKIVQTFNVGKGVRKLMFDEDGRFCFTVNRLDNTVSVIDVSRGKVVRTIPTGIRPESIALTPDFVYVRNTGSPDITVIGAKDFSKLKEISIGSLPPNSVDIKEDHFDIGISYAVMIPDPVDNIVYTVMFGDTETAFKYKTEGKGPSRLAFFWNGLKEVSPGLYSRVLRFDEPGRHAVGFYIQSPEVATCFEINAAENDK